MTNPSITFIGAGNMAQALIGGLIQAGHPAGRIRVADPDDEQRRGVADRFDIAAHADNATAAQGADVVMLAVKPQVMAAVLASLQPSITPATLVISVAAGITLEQLSVGLGGHRRCVRAMPNTPALHGAGVTGMVAGDDAGKADIQTAESIMGTAGKVVWVGDEALMDVVTAVSGSGPAYYFLLTELLTQAGTRAGLNERDAAVLARQTAVGVGTMLAESELDAAELRRRVTSPGGTTAAALESFEASGLVRIVEEAVRAAVARGRELGQC